MRDNVRAFIQCAAASFPMDGPIYEFGSYLVAGQEQLANLRPLFPDRQYVGCDMRPGPGVDRIEDLGHLTLDDGVAGAIICVDTLEHVFEVRKAVDEMIRVLRPGGLMLVSVPLDFRIHDYPDDYWRLTPSCIARLMAPLAATIVGSQGLEGYPHTVFGIGMKAPVAAGFPQRAGLLIRSFDAWCTATQRRQPKMQKFKRWISAWTRSKGERRRVRAEYSSRFAVQFPASSDEDTKALLDRTLA